MVGRIVLGMAVVAAMSGAAWAQVKAGGEFQVNTYTTGLQLFSVIAVERDADFTIAWVGSDSSDSGVLGQRFDAAGARRGKSWRAGAW
jgi:hypothetical protein